MQTIERKEEPVRQNIIFSDNAKVEAETINNINYYAKHSSLSINARIHELDREWDMERTLEINTATLALAGIILAYFVHSLWLLLAIVVTLFLIQHALQGWCPLLLLFRKLGIRTRLEIDREKYALKVLRGDFKNIQDTQDIWNSVSE